MLKCANDDCEVKEKPGAGINLPLSKGTKVTGRLNVNTKKYHVFAPIGRFQLELIYLYFPPSSQLMLMNACIVFLNAHLLQLSKL